MTQATEYLRISESIPLFELDFIVTNFNGALSRRLSDGFRWDELCQEQRHRGAGNGPTVGELAGTRSLGVNRMKRQISFNHG